MRLVLTIPHFHACRFVAVIVVPLPDPTIQLLPPENYTENRPFSSDLPNQYYVTAAWDAANLSSVPEVFTVGAEDIYIALPPDRNGKETYTNARLRSNTNYAIFVRYDIENDNIGATEVSIVILSMLSGAVRIIKFPLVSIGTSCVFQFHQ